MHNSTVGRKCLLLDTKRPFQSVLLDVSYGREAEVGLARPVRSSVSRGANWANPPLTDEAENTDGDSNFVSHDFQPGFDDTVLWLSPNTLFNRMVTAGQLP